MTKTYTPKQMVQFGELMSAAGSKSIDVRPLEYVPENGIILAVGKETETAFIDLADTLGIELVYEKGVIEPKNIYPAFSSRRLIPIPTNYYTIRYWPR